MDFLGVTLFNGETMSHLHLDKKMLGKWLGFLEIHTYVDTLSYTKEIKVKEINDVF